MPEDIALALGPFRSVRAFLNKPLALKHFAGALTLLAVPYVIGLTHGSAGFALGDSRRGLGIQSLISQVKNELSTLENERLKNRELPLFELKQFDLELSFIVRDNSKLTGHSTPFDLIAVDSETQIGSERVQKIMLHMMTVPPVLGSSNRDSGPPPSSTGEVLGSIPPPTKKAKP